MRPAARCGVENKFTVEEEHLFIRHDAACCSPDLFQKDCIDLAEARLGTNDEPGDEMWPSDGPEDRTLGLDHALSHCESVPDPKHRPPKIYHAGLHRKRTRRISHIEGTRGRTC